MPARWNLYLWVAAGTMLGGGLRALISHTAYAPEAAFPWATLGVNALGSFAIGGYAALTGPGGRVIAAPEQRQFFMAGVCGGLTTFSIFSLETLWLLEAGRTAGALGNVAASIGVCLLAVWAGFALGLRVNRPH